MHCFLVIVILILYVILADAYSIKSMNKDGDFMNITEGFINKTAKEQYVTPDSGESNSLVIYIGGGVGGGCGSIILCCILYCCCCR